MEFVNNIPIYVQIINDLKRRIIKGEIVSGEKMPSARELALEYKINPNTANRIYKELEAQGLCFTKRGLGTYFTEDKRIVENLRKELFVEIADELIARLRSFGYKDKEILEEIEKIIKDNPIQD